MRKIRKYVTDSVKNIPTNKLKDIRDNQYRSSDNLEDYLPEAIEKELIKRALAAVDSITSQEKEVINYCKDRCKGLKFRSLWLKDCLDEAIKKGIL